MEKREQRIKTATFPEKKFHHVTEAGSIKSTAEAEKRLQHAKANEALAESFQFHLFTCCVLQVSVVILATELASHKGQSSSFQI